MSFNDAFKCPLCHTRHSFRHCRPFLSAIPSDKEAIVRKYNGCVNCLGLGHRAITCPWNEGCRVCNFAHHSLLHPLDNRREVWLSMTAEVFIHFPGLDETPQKVRVLIDPLREESTLQMGLPSQGPLYPSPVRVVLTSTNNNVRTYTTNLKVLGESDLLEPRHPVDLKCVRKAYLKKAVADPTFEKPGKYNVVLGKPASEGIFLGLPVFERGMPYAQNTVFGWTFFGDVERKI
ncbi:uncharacterized protein LOC131803798 [Musca domestica]|uniref:Uncharacterized protein LOC131801366 n=1 Tax=Musca domestica TaxID=7370 RepID=A0ABM3UQW4_MUSDO|nr:uncharacterized protein LOC131801366 [Musca domestica]XP_058981496.1 uncharacterized protein LOC131803798 [Musca domestica]